MNLDMIASWFEALGVHPVLGSFFAGALLTLMLCSGKRGSRQDGKVSRAQAFLSENRPMQQSSSIKVEGSVISVKLNGKEIEIPAKESALIMEMLRGRQTIEAIKAVRLHSGLGLAEAKQFVEMLEKHLPRG